MPHLLSRGWQIHFLLRTFTSANDVDSTAHAAVALLNFLVDKGANVQTRHGPRQKVFYRPQLIERLQEIFRYSGF